MSRTYFLELAARGHRLPLAPDLILRRHPDPEAILRDGPRLGEVVAEAARTYGTPVAFPVMDLQLEKRFLFSVLQPDSPPEQEHHLSEAPSPEQRARFLADLAATPLPVRLQANVGAIRRVVEAHPDLLPVGMTIGPFSLMSKLLTDPITPVYLAGQGETAADNPDVALVEAALEMALAVIERSLEAQLQAGARAIFVAEPAANVVYLSPNQLAEGGDLLDRMVLRGHRRLRDRVEAAGADYLFHCCGELNPTLVTAYGALRPTLLSLGSSRLLWEDAARVPADVVLYGNLPSKRFYSDSLLPEDIVAELARDLAARMRATGHPFILGTECDTLHVEGSGETILRKVHRLLQTAST